MGLGKFLGKVANVLGGFAPLATIANPALGIALSTGAQALSGFAPQAPVAVSAGFPTIESLTGIPPVQFARVQPATNGMGGVPQPVQFPQVQQAGMGVLAVSRSLIGTIGKLATRLGIAVTLTNVLGVGSRLWRALTVFARRHPSLSLISMLTALGLTVEEASEYIAWGSTRRRRRRRGGVSGADMRIARRTIRRITGFQHDLSHLRTGAHHIRRSRPGSRAAGVSIVRGG